MRGTANLLEIQDMKAKRAASVGRKRITLASAAGRSKAAAIDRLMVLAGEMFCLHDHDLSIIQAAGAVEEICGLAARAVVGRRLEDLVHPDDRPALSASWSRISAGEAAQFLEFRMVLPAGQTLRVDARIFAVSNGSGQSRFGSAIRDVTRFHPARRKVRSGHDYLSGNIAAAEIAARMAHELSQPLASIGLAAENAITALAVAPAETALVAQKLERISQQAARAARLIDHMRFFGRQESGAAQPLDLSAALDGALLILDARLRRARVEVVHDIAPDLPQVFGAPVLVEQVMINLIANACDACKAAKPALDKERRRIEVSAFAKDRMVYLIVADHAGGIPEADLPQVFQPFFTTKMAGEGMGLGLSISYGIVSDMGGTMTVSNSKDGAVFELRLPANGGGETI